jgi:hypothetical protein
MPVFCRRQGRQIWTLQVLRAILGSCRRTMPEFPTFLRCLLFVSGLLTGIAPGSAQSITAGVGFLTSSQEEDGGWSSSEVRSVQASAEALRALQAVGQAPGARSAAVTFLEAEPIEDTDDRARRILVLAKEGRNVSEQVSQLLSDIHPGGGWGLTRGFLADSLDTTLVLAALSSQPAIDDEVLRSAFSVLVETQREFGGGWPCVNTPEADAEIFCTSEALLALASYRNRYFLDPQIEDAVGFLRGQFNPDGSFGPAGPAQVINTALASIALAAVPAFGNEVAPVFFFLTNRQQAGGSWGGDSYTTALVVRALHALSSVPFCGDSVINRAGEACDGGVPAGMTCGGLGMGAGNLACSSQCTLDTSGCSKSPRCGDNLRNQPFEICDGADLAAQTCSSLGFSTGSLLCAADCLSFNTEGCNAAVSCGDGIVNQASESCDLSDFRGSTCESLGLGGGRLSCTSDCNLDTAQCDAASFVVDNKGREFLVGFMQNFDDFAIAQVQLTSDVPTSVVIQYPVNSPIFSQTVNVNPGQVKTVTLPGSTHSGWAAGRVLNNAVRISATKEVVAYLVNRGQYSSDAGMGLPIDALGTSYIVTTYRGSQVHSGDRSQFLVLAPFDSTTVTITPTAAMQIPPPGVNAPPNVPLQVKLSRGQGFRGQAVSSTADLTGTSIESNRPIAVINGNVCTNIPTTVSFCDHVFEVAHPLRSWGTSALVTNLPNRPGGSIYRIVASVDGTQVYRDGVLQATLNRGKFLETGLLTGSHLFTANHPIAVVQFMTGFSSPGAIDGDPAMVNIVPPDQYLESYTFSTVGGGQFQSHFLTLIAPDAVVGSVVLDGTPIAPARFSAIAGTGFSSVLLPLTEGTHTTSSPKPHGITVEGFSFMDSYIYPGGARLEAINQFCGDGRANREPEACDENDFRGNTCTSFGFASGFLQCTADCRVDTSQCSGFAIEDKDDDDFLVNEDCNDRDPEVNPGMPEIPGNGVDDDCNPGTPDTIPQAALSCRLLPDRLSYSATDIVFLEADVINSHESFSLTGLSLSFQIHDAGETSIFNEARPLAPLPPGARAQQSFVLAATGHLPGAYEAELSINTGGTSLALCSADFVIENSASTGAGLSGDLTLTPELVSVGEPSDASYTVQNQGNATLADLAIRVLLLEPNTGGILGEIQEMATLEPGGSFSATQSFSTVGLGPNKSYMAVLLARPAGTDAEQTLDSASLTVVNAPPDCSHAVASRSDLRPPNHKMVPVTIIGVTDPDGDPVMLRVGGVFQDERTADLGSGDTCPDATGVGTAQASVRAERSGRQDGRVYHIYFTAEDGRGGMCEGEVQVCVRHDGQPNGTCVDQGALYDPTVCY